jgi:hypothetical protein
MAIKTTIIFLFSLLFIHANNIQDINLTSIKEGTQIELITYANQKKEINIIKKNHPAYYTPSSKKFELVLEPQILHSRFGTIYLYDLSRSGSYLNALSYDSMKLEGDLSNVTIGIADEQYYLRDDHLKLENKSFFSLNTLYDSINLSRLKYLVILSPQELNSPIKKIIFSKKILSHSKIKHPMESWSWNPTHITSTKLKSIPLKRVYVQIRKGFESALNEMNESNVSIYGLNGSPEDVLNYSHLLKDIEYLAKLKESYPKIEGFQIDVEPYLLSNYKKQRDTILKKYLHMIKDLKLHTEQYGLKFSVVIPFWFDQLCINHENFGFKVTSLVDEIVLMSYRSDLNEVIHISKPLLKYASYHKKEVRIGIELMKIEDEEHTLYSIIKSSTPCIVNGKLEKECMTLHKEHQYTVKGSDISFYKQTHKLANILAYDVPYSAFKGFVFHHFDLLDTLPYLNTSN